MCEPGDEQGPVSERFNYFNYFTEIEDRFQKRRGSLLLLSTLDWALIETWREAGIPLEAVLRGIDAAFDKYEARQRRGPMRRVNGLAWCAQAVMQAAEELQEAAAGSPRSEAAEKAAGPAPGFEPERVKAHLLRVAMALSAAVVAPEACEQTAVRLKALAEKIGADYSADSGKDPNTDADPCTDMEGLERTLVVLEEKLFAALSSAASVECLVELKEQAARELAAYRNRLTADQLRQVEKQFIQKRLLERARLQRLSLFYMDLR